MYSHLGSQPDLVELVLNRLNTLRLRWNEQNFANDIFKRIYFNENVWISIKISLKFVPKGPINNIPALVQIMAWRRAGDKPLSEPMMVGLPTHICVTRPQWVNERERDCVLAKIWCQLWHAYIRLCPNWWCHHQNDVWIWHKLLRRLWFCSQL